MTGGYSTAQHRTAYALGSVAVDVETDDVQFAHWLEHFLGPSIGTCRVGDAGVSVRYSCDADAFAALDRRAASATGTLPCFVLDSRLVHLPGWEDRDGLTLADLELSAFYRINDRRIEIVGRPGNRRSWLGAMRVVREILTTRTLAGGDHLDIHAAAFELGQRAVLIAGPKNTGKTTLLCYAVSSGDARVVANDRVLVDVGCSPPAVRGVPTLASARSRTFGFFPALRGGSAGRPTLLYPGEPELADAVRSISLRELSDRLGASSAAGASLAAIVFPEVVADEDTWNVTTVPRLEGLARLRSCLYGSSRNGSATVFETRFGSPSNAGDLTTVLDTLPDSVRCHHCRLGPRAYDRPAREWLSALALS